MKPLFTTAAVLTLTAPFTQVANGWDATGHRIITWMALDRLPSDAPAFLREEATRHAVAWNAGEPDRWRGERNPFLMNGTYMDHFIDIEDLEPLGMTLRTVPMLRYRFVRECAVARAKWPAGKDGNTKPYEDSKDPTGQQEFPGFIAHSICELHGKLTSQFKTLRMLQALNEPARDAQIKMTQANIMSTMGVLSHFAGDTAQPLHTTRHYNGWVGDNPHGYTTRKSFHSYIDGGLIRDQGIDYHDCLDASVAGATAAPLPPPGKDAQAVWGFTLDYIERSFAKMEPLYKLEKSGALAGDEGKAFVIERLRDGGATLGAIYASAWQASEPTKKEIEAFVRYDGFEPAQVPERKTRTEPRATPALPAEPSAP